MATTHRLGFYARDFGPAVRLVTSAQASHKEAQKGQAAHRQAHNNATANGFLIIKPAELFRVFTNTRFGTRNVK